jgi:hypothetical protein
MVNYQQSKIYQIVPTCEYDEDEIYIGSTCKQYLCQRYAVHTSKYRSDTLNCTSVFLFNKYGVENCKIELLEEYPCENKEQLNKREGEIIRERKCINKRIEGRTKTESATVYRNKEKNKEKAKKYNSEYRLKKKSQQIINDKPI